MVATAQTVETQHAERGLWWLVAGALLIVLWPATMLLWSSVSATYDIGSAPVLTPVFAFPGTTGAHTIVVDGANTLGVYQESFQIRSAGDKVESAYDVIARTPGRITFATTASGPAPLLGAGGLQLRVRACNGIWRELADGYHCTGVVTPIHDGLLAIDGPLTLGVSSTKGAVIHLVVDVSLPLYSKVSLASQAVQIGYIVRLAAL